MESFENCRLCLARSRFHRSFVGLWEKHCKWQRSLSSWSGAGKLDGQVIQATFSPKLSRDIVALQVEKRCSPYYHLRSYFGTQQISMLQFAAHSENHVLWLVKGVFCVSTIKPDERLAVTILTWDQASFFFFFCFFGSRGKKITPDTFI